jgi:indoleamine 2,3-dioxygenase
MISPVHLQTELELLRAHLVLSLIAHAYIVGFPKSSAPEPILPAALAVPWFQVSQALGLKPVVSYASLELANYKLLDPKKPCSLENLGMLHTFSGSFDEAWFYLVPLGIEVLGAPALRAILNIKQDLEKGQTDRLSELLKTIAQSLEQMTVCLKRMYDKNDPYVFWHRVRPYSG